MVIINGTVKTSFGARRPVSPIPCCADAAELRAMKLSAASIVMLFMASPPSVRFVRLELQGLREPLQ